MKKIIIILLSTFILSNNISASTKENSIKYRWYTYEIEDELYYQKGETLEGYLEDQNKVQYGENLGISMKYCNYSKEKYKIESKNRYYVTRVASFRYIKLENIAKEDINEIKIYHNYQLLPYQIIDETYNSIIIDIYIQVNPPEIYLYIDTNKEYEITMSSSKDFSVISLTKEISNQKSLVPDKTWINKNTSYTKGYELTKIENNDFQTLEYQSSFCTAQEIKTYRYKLKKVYYDDNYYEYIDGYIPDLEDYQVENNIIIKDNVITKLKYVYLEGITKEKIIEKLTNNSCQNQVTYKEKEITKKEIPKEIYLIIIVLLIISLIKTIIIIKKSRIKHLSSFVE